jgi:hypothetical protein
MLVESSRIAGLLFAAAALIAGPGPASAAPLLHGPGSTHNPIIRMPAQLPAGTHRPTDGIVSPIKPVAKPDTGPARSCIPRGSIVSDHRNGKECSYVAGDRRSYQRYLQCEGARGGFQQPWC